MAIFHSMAADRRRRLYLLGLIPSSSADAPSAAALATNAATSIVRGGQTGGTSPAVPAVPASSPFRPLGEAVRDLGRPMTWVFSGQSLPGQLGESTEVPLSGIVGLYVRNGLERSSDPIIDTTGPDLRVIDLLQQFDKRVARFHPQVVVIGGSLIEADRGIAGLPRFERNLVRLIHACRRIGSDIVLQTPRFVAGESSAEEIDGPVYVEAIRSIAAEQGVGLVDHWTAEAATPLDPSVRIAPTHANAYDMSGGGGTSGGDGMKLLARFVNDLDLPGAESTVASTSGAASASR